MKTGPLAKIFTVLESTRRELSNGINLIVFACTTYNALQPYIFTSTVRVKWLISIFFVFVFRFQRCSNFPGYALDEINTEVLWDSFPFRHHPHLQLADAARHRFVPCLLYLNNIKLTLQYVEL